MNPDEKKIEAFKNIVIESSSNPDFIHHAWFVEYHLNIVERIAKELLQHYPEANSSLVRILVWLHDYGKSVDFSNQYITTLTEGRKQLKKLDFDNDFIDTIIEYMDIMDKKLELDITKAPIEVQIVSSADGCSHFIGPFMQLWWWENAHKDYKELMDDNKAKAIKDWTRKIVLPEARNMIGPRYTFILEQSGDLPDKFLS